ncbi:murein biosynthesis integral membrane protein MurJ [bacterium]|nr:murein biosynthesis integral membrane protein MurJ [bacterium]
MSMQKNASKISAATFLSRILGLVREQIFAAVLGAGYFADAFIFAFRIPNLFRDLFAEGALSQAFVPTIAKFKEKQSQQATLAFFQSMLAMLILIVGFLTVLGIFLAPVFVDYIAPGFADIPGKRDLTIKLTRILFPFLLFVSCAALFMSVLNVYQEFLRPALAPAVFNLCSISVGLWVYFADFSNQTAVYAWAMATTFAGLAQASMQVPKLWRYGYRLIPKFKGVFKHPGVKTVLYLMLPAIIANAGTQVNVLVNTSLASLLEEGSISWLNYAFRLMQLPIGVFGVAISVVTLSQVSNLIAQNKVEDYKKNVSTALSFTLLLTLPSTIGLLFLGQPIIAMIYQRGLFDLYDTQNTFTALYFYSFGLPFYAGVKVLAPIFFAFDKSKIPTYASLTGIAVNIVFNLMYYKILGHGGLALGTSLAMLVNFLILLITLHVQEKIFMWSAILKSCAKIIIASCVIIALCVFIWPWLNSYTAIPSFVRLLGFIALVAGFYFTVLMLMKTDELNTLQHKIKTLLHR